jgi:hypothetical protein
VSWLSASARGAIIILYLVIATVVIPNAILRMGAIAQAPSFVQDLVPLAVWSIGLFGGLYGMRVAQSRGLI